MAELTEYAFILNMRSIKANLDQFNEDMARLELLLR